MRKFYFTFLLTPLLLLSQNPEYNPRQFTTNFEKQNITWTWRSQLYLFDIADSSWSYNIKNNLQTTLIRPTATTDKWHDENSFSGLFYRPSGEFTPGIYANSWTLVDRQSDSDNRFSSNVLGIYSVVKPWEYIELRPYAGYQRSEIRSVEEWGLDAGLAAKINRFELENYTGEFYLNLDYDEYEKRRNSGGNASINLRTRFSSKAEDSISVVYDVSNKQYFSISSDRLINVNMENKSLYNHLRYQTGRRSWLDYDFSFRLRTIFDNSREANKREVFYLANRLHYTVLSGDHLWRFGIDTYRETQDNSGIRTDSEASQTNLKTDLDWLLNENSKLLIKLAYSKFQYDTPDTVFNNDDRDEQRFIGSIIYQNMLSEYLLFSLYTHINMYHQIYLLREQSGNNNWNRIYRLGSDIKYSSRYFRNKIRNEILANYTEYDFEKLFNQTRSIVFRQYTFEDSAYARFLPNLHSGINFKIELEDRGNFFKKEFAQKLIQTTNAIFADIFVRFKNVFRFDLDGGVYYYNRKDWFHQPEKELSRDIRTISPYFRIMFIRIKYLNFNAYVSKTYLKEMGRPKNEYYNGRLNAAFSF